MGIIKNFQNLSNFCVFIGIDDFMKMKLFMDDYELQSLGIPWRRAAMKKLYEKTMNEKNTLIEKKNPPKVNLEDYFRKNEIFYLVHNAFPKAELIWMKNSKNKTIEHSCADVICMELKTPVDYPTYVVLVNKLIELVHIARN